MFNGKSLKCEMEMERRLRVNISNKMGASDYLEKKIEHIPRLGWAGMFTADSGIQWSTRAKNRNESKKVEILI